MRLAGLLHDVGHGPFGHFFDEHFLRTYGLTHESLGGVIIQQELAELIRGIRRTPTQTLNFNEELDPAQIVFLITRPGTNPVPTKPPLPHIGEDDAPRWLVMLRSLFCGQYTVDNMDFVLRDAYMSGYSSRSFDLARLLHYSRFTEQGLTIHERGLSALVRFIQVRAELFRAIYFHRTVRAVDLSLVDLFRDSKQHLFDRNPLEALDEYIHFTEWSMLDTVSRWAGNDDPELRSLGERWQRLLGRQIDWKMACERTVFFQPGQSETASVLSDSKTFEVRVRSELPESLQEMPLRVDTARHVHRPGSHMPTAGQNFLFEPSSGRIVRLDERELYRNLSISYRICRIYTRPEDSNHHALFARVMDRLTGVDDGADDLTNM